MGALRVIRFAVFLVTFVLAPWAAIGAGFAVGLSAALVILVGWVGLFGFAIWYANNF